MPNRYELTLATVKYCKISLEKTDEEAFKIKIGRFRIVKWFSKISSRSTPKLSFFLFTAQIVKVILMH